MSSTTCHGNVSNPTTMRVCVPIVPGRNRRSRCCTGKSQSNRAGFVCQYLRTGTIRRDTGKSQSRPYLPHQLLHPQGARLFVERRGEQVGILPCVHTHHIIEAPWLVNGGHGASLRRHNEWRVRTHRGHAQLDMSKGGMRCHAHPRSPNPSTVGYYPPPRPASP
jgi:hypothetical protein